MDVKLYDVTIDSDVYALSLVTEPAIEVDFIALAKEKPLQVALEKGEKKMLVGAALIPGKPIYRYDDWGEYYIRFSAETIEKLAHDYLMSDRIYSFTEQHKEVADGICLVESWISQGGDTYGLDVPKGTWMVMAKVDNPDIWDKVKKGELRGFSIEAMAGLEEIINSKIENNMAKEIQKEKLEAIEVNDGFWTKLKEILAGILGQEAETPAEAAQAEETASEAVEVAKEEAQVETVETTETTVEASKQEKKEEKKEESKEVEMQASIDSLNASIAEKDKAIAEKDAKIKELEEKVEKLSKQPSAKPVVKTEASKDNKDKKDARSTIEALYNGTYFSKK